MGRSPPSVSVCLVSDCLLVCLFVFVFLLLFLSASVFLLLSLSFFIYLCPLMSVYVCLYLFPSVSVSLFLSPSVSVCLFLTTYMFVTQISHIQHYCTMYHAVNRTATGGGRVPNVGTHASERKLTVLAPKKTHPPRNRESPNS